MYNSKSNISFLLKAKLNLTRTKKLLTLRNILLYWKKCSLHYCSIFRKDMD